MFMNNNNSKLNDIYIAADANCRYVFSGSYFWVITPSDDFLRRQWHDSQSKPIEFNATEKL